MTPGSGLDILDLRHFSAPVLKPLLMAEGMVWRERLEWDYMASARLLLQYLETRSLPGYVASDGGRVAGYAFCVYEDTKAVIGDVFALEPEVGSAQLEAAEVERALLTHIIELLKNSPGVDRIESQLLLHPDTLHGDVFIGAGFEVYRRLYLRLSLEGERRERAVELPPFLEMRPWQETDMAASGRLITNAYEGHTDSTINDQYRTVNGSLRFLQNIVRYPGCGEFSRQGSHVVMDRVTREMVGLVLGSRVSPECGHITQVCVADEYRRMGVARALLRRAAAEFQRMGVAALTLTVTEANTKAVELYTREGYEVAHRFNAAVWRRA